MVWTTINGQNFTPYIKHDNFRLDMGISDNFPQCSFEVQDNSSSLGLVCGDFVMLWDEFVGTYYLSSGATVQTMPSINQLIDPSIASGSTNYGVGGTNAALVSFSAFNCNITFNNNTIGLANDAHAMQNLVNAWYVTPGQQYMFSAYVKGTNPVNLQAYVQINWLDGSGNFISSSGGSAFTPPTTQTRFNCSGVAPANAVFTQIQFGAYATNATNSGTVNFQTLQLEPVWFQGYALGNGTPMSYPTPDNNFYSPASVQMPDGTYARAGRLFFGYIAQLSNTYKGTVRTWTVTCKSYADVSENGGTNTPINEVYPQAGVNSGNPPTDAQIITHLVGKYFPSPATSQGTANGGLSTGQTWSSAPSSTVVAGPVIDSAQYTDQTLRQILNNLSDISGYIYFIDAYGYVYYNDVPYTYSPFKLIADPNNQPDNLTTFAPIDYEYDQDATQMRNSVKVTGGTFLLTYQNTFNGDGATKVFNLATVPATSIVSVSVNGGTSVYAPTAANKIGVAGQQVNGVGGVVVLMNAAGTSVTFNVAPATGTNNVQINYTVLSPVTVLVEENSSIGQFGRRFVSTVSDSSLSSNAAAKVRGESELSTWAYPVQNIKFKLANHISTSSIITGFIQPGTTIYLTSTLDGLSNAAFVVQTCKMTSQGAGVNIYEYEAGTYRPTLKDVHRNVQKALNKTLAPAGVAPIQLTYEVIRDSVTYSESFRETQGSPPAVAQYNIAQLGYTSFR